MTRLLASLAFVIGLLLAAGAWADQEPSERIDFAVFVTVAEEVERLVADRAAPEAVLMERRNELISWRLRLLAAQSANQRTIQRLQAQLGALGPLPEEGVVDASEIAERRTELGRQLAEAQVPHFNALEAFNRANGLIAEIDVKLRQRQTAKLLQRAPSPLLPASLAAAGRDGWTVFRAVRAEVAEPEAGERFVEAAVPFALVVAAGLLLLVRGRAWVGRLSKLAYRLKARETVVFLVSLGQVFLPALGAVLLLVAVAITGIPGERAMALILGVGTLIVSSLTALWMANRLFPAEGEVPAALDVPVGVRARARSIVVAIGVLLGVGTILGALSTFEEVSEAARAVYLLPLLVALSVALWWLAVVLDGLGRPAETEAEAPNFFASLISLVAIVLRLVAVLGSLLALAGYVNAAEGVMRSTALSLGLLALFLVVQVPIRDLYCLITRSPAEEASRALLPVLVNFGLALLSLPIFALVWGMRPSEIAEIWSRVQGGISIGDTRITPGAVLMVALVFAAVLLLTRLLQGALKSTVLPRTKLDTGARNAVVAGVGYVGAAVAALAGINAAGIDLTTLAFVISALSIGIGFGLRNVIENFVAGLILLIERPIGEGDWIEVGGNMGIVKQISVRSTVIETFDRQQLIVPNGDFITGTVTNWTRGSQVGRAVVTVGVAYGSDTRKVQQILLDIAKEQSGVMRFPEPGVDFMQFGADSLDFRVRALLHDVKTLVAVRTEMHHRIAERFIEEGIEIPFAQRDIWLRNPEALTAHREAPAIPPPVVIPTEEVNKPPAKRRRGPLRRDPESLEAAADQDGEQS